MKTLNLDSPTDFLEVLIFSDTQPHVKTRGLEFGEEVEVICTLDSCSKIIMLLELVNALKENAIVKKRLYIPYLLGARSDRHMVKGDSFDLQVIAQLINLCEFEEVHLTDVHSPIALSLIYNSKNYIPNLLANYKEENPLFICPDKGASIRLPYYSDYADYIYCKKVRNLDTGYLNLVVRNPEKAKDRNCVIVDDICDGGRTFLAIASQISPKHLTLAVTHGIFSNGIKKLVKSFDKIITTDTLKNVYYYTSYRRFEVIKLEKGK